MEIKYKRFFEKKLLGTTIWSPLANGILAGKYNKGIPEDIRYGKNPGLGSVSNFGRLFSKENEEETRAALCKFEQLAKELECSMAQLAMAWCISNPDVSTAITGATRPQQLVDTCQAVKLLPKLTPDVQKRIEDIFKTEPTPKIDLKTFAPFKNRRRILLDY